MTNTSADLWRFRPLRGGREVLSTLWLYPELECSACVDDAEDQTGAGQLAYYLDYVRRRHCDWWLSDAVEIFWSIRGDKDVFEPAPVPWNDDQHFLTHLSSPVHVETGEPLNWYKLPVRNDRFPEFGEALGWLPSPFQRYAPLRSVMTNATALLFGRTRRLRAI